MCGFLRAKLFLINSFILRLKKMLQNKFLILFFLNRNQKIGNILSYLQTDEHISSFYFVSSKFYLVYTNFLIK